MICYRIYTENKNLHKIRSAVKSFFPQGATIYDTHGIFEGSIEESVVIELIVSQERETDVMNLAKDIKVLNEQIAVKITSVHLLSDITV